MPSLLRATTALAAIALGVLAAPRADACMWIDCEHADLRAGPANVPVLVHVADERWKTTIPTFVVRDEAGDEIPISIAAEGHAPGVWLLRPSSPLPAGAQVTAEAPACPSMAKQHTLSARVDAAAAEPTAAGTLVTSAPRDAKPEDDVLLTCGSGAFVGRAVDVELVADPTLEPYLPITTIELRIDGEPYVDRVRGVPVVGPLATTLVARCDAPPTATARIDPSCAGRGRRGPSGRLCLRRAARIGRRSRRRDRPVRAGSAPPQRSRAREVAAAPLAGAVERGRLRAARWEADGPRYGRAGGRSVEC